METVKTYMIETQDDWGLSRGEFEAELNHSLKLWCGSQHIYSTSGKGEDGRQIKNVLLIPPDFTRMHSGAGEITAFFYRALKSLCHVDVMPALGTHDPMTEREVEAFFLGEIPISAVIVHDWRKDVVKIGEIPAAFVNEVSEGLMNAPIEVKINRRLIDKSYDLIISIGQVVPHEVAGMANYSKNIFVGCGGDAMINATHMLGALYGIERVMGIDKSPVRMALDYAEEHFIADIPLVYVLTTTSNPDKPANTTPGGFTPALSGGVVLHGLYIGRERRVYESAVEMSRNKNLTLLSERPRKIVAYLDPAEYKSAWLGNKAIYRTRKAIADKGELVIIAPGVRKFGEDALNDILIRKYGYKGRDYVLSQCENNVDLRENLSVAAHLIHGSSEGRFTITYAAGGLSREEVESAGFDYTPVEKITQRYDPKTLKDGYNKLPDGESVYYISNPALGLWTAEDSFPNSRENEDAFPNSRGTEEASQNSPSDEEAFPNSHETDDVSQNSSSAEDVFPNSRENEEVSQNSPSAEEARPNSRTVESAFPNSRRELDGSVFWIDYVDGTKRLIVTENTSESSVYSRLNGEESYACSNKAAKSGKEANNDKEAKCGKAKICPLSHENANIIREVFPFTAPVSHKGRAITLGLGDRLGLASPGHIDLIRNYDIFPVLAQQSIRELTLTGRNFGDVLDSATWAVFQEGYTAGFGADGDHLKTIDEVKMALEQGFSMITLDCSEHIQNNISTLDENAINFLYNELPAEKREQWEVEYLSKPIILDGGMEVAITKDALERDSLIYGGAIEFAERVYRECVAACERSVDFELSVDETPAETLPGSHYFVANELYRQGVVLTSLAPRFAGEFQKGIDYLGDLEAFEKGFIVHADIARHFGYKISVHSGSDKFSVFPMIGKYSKGVFHLKTAGTNWLEALRVISREDARLFRLILDFAINNLAEAKKYYVTTEDIANIPPTQTLTDAELPGLLNNPDARQVLHICYGAVLQKGQDTERGKSFREQIYELLLENDKAYRESLRAHIKLHLDKLGINQIDKLGIN